MFHYFTIKFHFSFFASFRFKFFASLRFSNFCFEAKQSEAKFKSIFCFFILFHFFSLFFAFFPLFSLNFRFASIFSLNFRLFYLRFRFRFLVFRIEVNHVKSGFFFASKQNEIFASISNFASEAKVRAHPSLNCTWTCLQKGVFAAPGCVYIIGPELHLDVFRLPEPVLLLMDFFRLFRGMCCTLKCQQSWCLNCISTYLANRSFCWSGHIYSIHGTIAA